MATTTQDCPECNGTGADEDGEECEACQGTGELEVEDEAD